MVNTVCAVACCKKEAYPGCGIPFHRVPGHPAIRKKWIEAIPGNITNSAVVCGAHFREDDYVSMFRKKLKFGTVPSVFPNCQLWLKVVGNDGVVDLSMEDVQTLQACHYHKYKYFKDINQSTNQTTNQVNELSSSVRNTAVNFNKNTALDKNEMVIVNHDEAFDDNNVISLESGDQNEEYKCNECQKFITGFRYTCVQCPDWDLCGACEARAAHAAHYVLRVPRRRKHEETKAVLDAIKKQLLKDDLLQDDSLDDRRLVEAVYEVPRGASSACASVKSENEYVVETLDEWSSEEETDSKTRPPKRRLPPETDQSVPTKKTKLRPGSSQTRKEISKQNKPDKIQLKPTNDKGESNSNKFTIPGNTTKKKPITTVDTEDPLNSQSPTKVHDSEKAMPKAERRPVLDIGLPQGAPLGPVLCHMFPPDVSNGNDLVFLKNVRESLLKDLIKKSV